METEVKKKILIMRLLLLAAVIVSAVLRWVVCVQACAALLISVNALEVYLELKEP